MHFFATSVPSRYFTPAEANEILPEIRAYLEGAINLEQKLRRLEQSVSSMQAHEDKVRHLREESARLVESIRAAGVEVKGLARGRLDFPALRNGEPVFLCWQLGEAQVEHWHPVNGGFKGRQRIDKDPLARWQWRN